jgi:hypothetical protein
MNSKNEHVCQKLIVRLGFKSKSTGKFKYRSKSFYNVKRSDYEELSDKFIKECKAPRNHYLRTCSAILFGNK